MDVKGPLGTTTIEEHTRLHARARSCTRRVLVKGARGTGVCMRAQARNADVPTKLNLPFPGAN